MIDTPFKSFVSVGKRDTGPTPGAMTKAMGIALCGTIFMGCAPVQEKTGHISSESEMQSGQVTLRPGETFHLPPRHRLQGNSSERNTSQGKPSTPKWVVHLLEDLGRSE